MAGRADLMFGNLVPRKIDHCVRRITIAIRWHLESKATLAQDNFSGSLFVNYRLIYGR